MASKAFVCGPVGAEAEWREAFRMLLTSPRGLRVYRLIDSSGARVFEDWRMSRWGHEQRYYDRAKYACTDHRLDYFVEAVVFITNSRNIEQVWQELREAFDPIKDCVRDRTRVLVVCPDVLRGLHPGQVLQTKATVAHDYYGRKRNIAMVVDEFTKTLV